MNRRLISIHSLLILFLLKIQGPCHEPLNKSLSLKSITKFLQSCILTEQYNKTTLHVTVPFLFILVSGRRMKCMVKKITSYVHFRLQSLHNTYFPITFSSSEDHSRPFISISFLVAARENYFLFSRKKNKREAKCIFTPPQKAAKNNFKNQI